MTTKLRHVCAAFVIGALALGTNVIAPSAQAAGKRCTFNVPTNLGSTHDGLYTLTRSGDTVTADFNVAGTSTLHCDERDPLNNAAVTLKIHDHVVLKNGTDLPVTGDARIHVEDLSGVLFDGAAQIHGTGGCDPNVCNASYTSSDLAKKKKKRHHHHKPEEHVHLNVLMNLNAGDVVTYQLGSGSFFDHV